MQYKLFDNHNIQTIMHYIHIKLNICFILILI